MWTEERNQKLTELWISGASGAVIAKEMGISRNAVFGKVFRLGLTGSRATQTVVINKAHWPEEHVAQLLQLFKLGHSTTYIAAEMGLRPYQVCSKLSRLGVERSRRKPKPTFHFGKAEKLPAEPPIQKEFLGVRLEDLADDQCRFARGDGPFLFCGQRKIDGSSYCAYCHSLCWVRPQDRKRAA